MDWGSRIRGTPQRPCIICLAVMEKSVVATPAPLLFRQFIFICDRSELFRVPCFFVLAALAKLPTEGSVIIYKTLVTPPSSIFSSHSFHPLLSRFLYTEYFTPTNSLPVRPFSSTPCPFTPTYMWVHISYIDITKTYGTNRFNVKIFKCPNLFFKA
jgi:hypothetical protein